jgi:PAS domain S-box-containing protein
MSRDARGDESPRRYPTAAHKGEGLRPRDRASVPHDSPVSYRLREYADGSPLAVAVVDGDTHALRYANPAFQRMCGAGGERVLGRTLADAAPHPGADRVAVMLRQVHETGESESDVEIEPEGTEAESVVLSVTAWAAPDRLAGRRSGPGDVVLQVRDVTAAVRERRDAAVLADELREINARLLLATFREEELKEQAQAANAAKSAFLATMSHELRTPLTAIIGYEYLLARGHTGPVNEQQREQLACIHRSANHLLALIDEVLTFAHLEANREPVHRQAVNLAELLEESATLVAPLAAAKGLTYTVRPPEHPLTLETDPLKVRQILVNLLGNAVKFTASGSIELIATEDRHTVVVSVRDTGIGIPREHLDHVFTPFWQVNQTATRSAGGTGLGLSVARRLARLLGGDVMVASVLGRGSTFTLWLPRDSPQEADPAPDAT